MTDRQASVGVAQMDKIEGFITSRNSNWDYIHKILSHYKKFFRFVKVNPNSQPSWFGFYMEVRDEAPFSKTDLVDFLEKHNIQTRQLFSGNITKQPMFDHLTLNKDYRIVSTLNRSDQAMNSGFWVGVNPAFTSDQLEYIKYSLEKFLKKYE